MFYIKYGIPIIIAVIVVVLMSSGGVLYYYKTQSPGGKTVGEGVFEGYRKIDKLFTAFAYIPLVQYKKGHLKREILTGRALFKEKDAIKGYCFRQYEVGIGYDQVSELFPQHQQAACNNDSLSLPTPMILSTNPIASEALGTYTRQECDSWDVGNLDERESRQLIADQLAGEQWQDIVENSQKILMSFMRVYCNEEEMEGGVSQ